MSFNTNFDCSEKQKQVILARIAQENKGTLDGVYEVIVSEVVTQPEFITVDFATSTDSHIFKMKKPEV